MPTTRLDIGIAGAGIAGLVAGRELQRSGHRVLIFESRLRTGGRIQSLKSGDYVVECGPEFIHGKLKETISLLKEFNIPYVPANGKMYRLKDGRLTEAYEIGVGWDRLLDKMKSLESDLTLHEFLMRYFPGDDNSDLRKSAIRFAQGFDLADIQTASTQALIAEWEHEESEQYRIPSGYGSLIQSLENDFKRLGGKISLGHAVKKADWNSDKVRLVMAGEDPVEIDKLIISLPVGLLNKKSPEPIHFTPQLPEIENAAGHIGYGSVIKIVMIWEEAFWKNNIPDAQFIFGDQFFPTWWTHYPLDVPMLTGWLGGPPAEKVSGSPEDFFLEKALDDLSAIFSVPAEKLKQSLKEYFIFDWKKEPWTRGAYSFSQIGYKDYKRICRQSIQRRIYFAGEAYYDGPYPGTVEAAVVSGLETAGKLLEEGRDNN